LHTFFFSSEHSIKKQADYKLGPETEGLCALAVPYTNYIVRTANEYEVIQFYYEKELLKFY